MSYSAKVIAASRTYDDQFNTHHLTTMEIVLPWYITPELLRHRMFSFSSQSTRAIPFKRMLKQVREHPAMPLIIGPNEPGMQAHESFTNERIQELWERFRMMAITTADELEDIVDRYDPHKQCINKYLIPFLWCKIIVTGTAPAFANFFSLRRHEAAAPEMFEIAGLMADGYVSCDRQDLESNEWHLPYIDDEDRMNAEIERGLTGRNPALTLADWSAARVARVSVTPFDSKTKDPTKDFQLADRLKTSEPVHASPFEHVAVVKAPGLIGNYCPGNFGYPWQQYRHMLPGNTSRMFIWKGVEIG